MPPPQSSAGGLVSRLPRDPSSLRRATPTSASSSSSAAIISQVADNFTLHAAASALTPEAHLLEPLPDRDVASDACSSSAAPEWGGRPDAFEVTIPAANARRAAVWEYVRVVALALRVAVLAATLAVVVTADVVLAIQLFPRRGAN